MNSEGERHITIEPVVGNAFKFCIEVDQVEDQELKKFVELLVTPFKKPIDIFLEKYQKISEKCMLDKIFLGSLIDIVYNFQFGEPMYIFYTEKSFRLGEISSTYLKETLEVQGEHLNL